MNDQRPHSPTRGGVALRAVPSLVFEITRTVGTMSTAGFGAGYASATVKLMAEQALTLQRDLGVEPFMVLLILAMSAKDTPEGLEVERPNPLIVEQTGWHRNKAAKILTALEASGFIQRPERNHVMEGGQVKYAPTKLLLSPALSTTLERRLSVATTERVLASPERTAAFGSTTATDRTAAFGSTTTADPTAALRSSTSSSATERGSASEGAGQATAASRSTASAQQLHVDVDEDEVHSRHLNEDDPPAADAVDEGSGPSRPEPAPPRPDEWGELRPLAALGPALDAQAAVAALAGRAPEYTVVESRELTSAEIVDLLTTWRVFRAERVVQETPRAVLLEAVATVSSRWGEIENPGAYLRRLLGEARRGGQPSPRRPELVRASPSPRQNDAGPGATAQGSDHGSWLDSALASLTGSERDELERRAQAVVDAEPFVSKSPGLARGRMRLALIAELERLGIVEPGAASEAG